MTSEESLGLELTLPLFHSTVVFLGNALGSGASDHLPESVEPLCPLSSTSPRS